MIGFIIIQFLLGLALATVLIAAVFATGGPVVSALAAEAARQPGQLVAIWLGGAGPFAVGFLATALAQHGG